MKKRNTIFRLTIRELLLLAVICGVGMALFLARSNIRRLESEKSELRRQILMTAKEFPHLKLDFPDPSRTVFSNDSRPVVSGYVCPRNFPFSNKPRLTVELKDIHKEVVYASTTEPYDTSSRRFHIQFDRQREIIPGYYKYVVTLRDGNKTICSAMTVVIFVDLDNSVMPQ